MRYLLRLALLAAFLGASGVSGQQPEKPEKPESQPRFRGGANLVRLDTFVTVDGVPVKDLTVNDFEVLEDNVPQRVESFELVQPRGPASAAALREPNTVAEAREMARDPEARVFVLFLDTWHVQIEGSHHAKGPLTRLLHRVIGQDDMVGVMTPDMAARTLTLARKTNAIEGILNDHWFWGQRNRLNTVDPREQEIERCYPPNDPSTAGLADEMIMRRRESKTLDALEDLIVHLEGLREERKFVVLLTEGWLLPPANPALAKPIVESPGSRRIPGGPEPIGVDPSGRLRVDSQQGPGVRSCDRERSTLAHSDLQMQFQELLQRANRANVSFYPLDARGLVVFDEPIGPKRPPPPSVDAARLSSRRTAVRTLAENTDGYAIVDTGNIDKALDRMVADTGAYYLLGYYSTNTKLDGRYRRLTVRVKRPGTDVRARPGYLAPTEAEAASARVDALMNGAAPGHTTIPPSIARAFNALAPARGNVPMRVQLAGAPGKIWLTGELDAATLKMVEWQKGGKGRLTFEHDRGAAARFDTDVTLEPGQRSFSASPPPGVTIASGRYVVRVVMTPTGGAVPLQTSAEVTVPEAGALISPSGLALRRGPSTGLQYVPTADSRYRRTERIRLEVPRGSGEGDATARLLGRDGQTLNVSIALSERVEASSEQRLIVAELPLAALAQGEYVLEVSLAQGEKKDTAAYAFRLIP